MVLPGKDKCYQAHTVPSEGYGSMLKLNALTWLLDGFLKR
jgi:hypothetical protein